MKEGNGNRNGAERNSGTIILGVDPGTNILGYSIISGDKNTIKILIHGIIRLKKKDDHYARLRIIFDKLNALIVAYGPEILAIEAPFFGKNVQSMLKLGRAQGAAIVAAAYKDLSITEYSPRKIKQSITGNGNASKEQVAKMLQTLCGLTALPDFFDETDALAVAVCHYFASRNGAPQSKKSNSWETFINQNPGRVAKAK